MSFSDSPAAVVRELDRELAGYPSVVATDTLDADASPRDRAELEVIVEATDRATLPNAVLCAVVRSSLGIGDVSDWNAPETLRVVIR